MIVSVPEYLQYISISHHASSTPSCGSTVAGKGFFCCSKTGGNRFVKDRSTCCASDPNADPNSCPKSGQPAPGFSAGILDPIASTLGGTPSASEQKKKQPTSAGGTCTLPSQDQDCCGFSLGEQTCVAGKSFINGVQNTIGATNCFGIPGLPCLVAYGGGAVLGALLLITIIKR